MKLRKILQVDKQNFNDALSEYRAEDSENPKKA